MAAHGCLLLDRLRAVAHAWARHQSELVMLAAELADGSEWIADGSPTAAHWLAAVADVETCTAREWIRIGRQLARLPASADAFVAGRISYSKVRTLTRVATPDNETDLVAIAEHTPASDLARELARWMHRTHSATEIAGHQHRQRGLRWRHEPDGTVAFSARLEPLAAGRLIAALQAKVMIRTRPTSRPGVCDGGWPSVAQQYADALDALVTNGTGGILTEVIVHVRGDGATLDDGTPIAGSIVERIAPGAFLRVLTHDANRRPINASGRHRHPSTRQKRVVKERDRCCVDCGRNELLEYDHVPDYDTTHHTLVEELQLRCAPCHQARHKQPTARSSERTGTPA